MAAFVAVYLRELILLKRRLRKMLSAAAVGPLLYLITFGYALGGHIAVDGRDYMTFLLPGLAAMSSMTQAFSMASEINIARFYSAIFEEIQASPARRLAYVAGEVCAGMTRVALGCAVIIVLGALFGIWLRYGVLFWLGILLNGFVFSSLAVCLAMLVTSHADQGLLNTFVITPMAFLGGTFFPLEKLPDWLRWILSALPLSHASRAVRAAALGGRPDATAYLTLAGFGCLFFFLALRAVAGAKD